jgi:hypothetical protein
METQELHRGRLIDGHAVSGFPVRSIRASGARWARLSRSAPVFVGIAGNCTLSGIADSVPGVTRRWTGMLPFEG